MALTRKFLNALGIEESKIESIIDAHTETVDALKKERDSYKAEAEKLPEVQKELDKAKAAAKDSGEFEKLKKEYDDFKAEVAGKETLAKKKAALKKLAAEKAKLSDTGVEKALKYSDFEKIELDDKGEIKDPDGVADGLKTEWSDYVQTSEQKGAGTPNPPTGGGSGTGSGTGGGTSRAAQLYQQHHTALYGQIETKGANSK